MKAVIALGSNLGHREMNLRNAKNILSKYFKLIKESKIIETNSFYNILEPKYLNQVISFESFIDHYETLRIIKLIEKTIGRKSYVTKNLPRIIDIDIIDFGGIIINEKELILPHRSMHERIFVLEPLLEIDPNWIHPVSKKNIFQIIKELKET